MNSWNKLNKNQSGQAALEAAIILIAFVVVASVFAFAILSAGSSSTQKGEQAIYSGLQNVQSSLELKGAVLGASAGSPAAMTDLFVTVALVSGGAPVNLDPASLVISYHDAVQTESNLPLKADWPAADDVGIDWTIHNGSDLMLREGDIAKLDVDLSGLAEDLPANTAFTLEITPQTGGVLVITRTTPPALEAFMELR